EVHGGGDVVLTRGRVFGLEVAEWRLPLQFGYSPREGRGDLTVSDSAATIALGRAVGRARFTWNDGARLEGSLRFYEVDLRSLTGSTGEFSSVAAGRLSGRVEFGGGDIRSANDLTASVSATLRQAQALQLPVLSQLVPFLRAGTSSATFQSG